MNGAAESPHCDDHLERMVRVEARMDAAWKALDKHGAVLFGTNVDEQGGLLAEIRSMKTWAKAVVFVVMVELILFGPERITTAWKFLAK